MSAEIRERMVAAGLWNGEDERDPSESIDTAWQVVEKMRADGWAYSLTDGAQTFHDCHFYQETDEQPDFYALADTAPLAICDAALKAVGVA